MEAVCHFIKLNVHLPYDPEILLLDIYILEGNLSKCPPPPKKKGFVQRMLFIHNIPKLDMSQVPVKRRMDKKK